MSSLGQAMTRKRAGLVRQVADAAGLQERLARVLLGQDDLADFVLQVLQVVLERVIVLEGSE